MTRAEAIKTLEKMKYPYKGNKYRMMISNVNLDNEALKMAIKALSQEPFVTPSRPTGHWFNNQNGTYECDKCGCKHSRSKYCPNCGCRMVEPKESEDKE